MRARDIKPGFYKNEQLAECSIPARFIFPGLWMLADREGRLEYRPKRLKAELLPYDHADIPTLIAELEAQRLVVKYVVDSQEYLWITGFSRNQSPHIKEKPSVLPACPMESPVKHGASMVQAPYKHGANLPSSLTPSSLPPEDLNTLTTFECLSSPSDGEPSDTPIGQGEKDDPGPGEDQSLAESGALKPPACPCEELIAMYHAALPEHQRVAVLNAKRRGAVKARWGEVGKRLKDLGRSDKPPDRLEWFSRFFAKAAASDFLTGKKAFRDGTVYRVDFDKLMSPSGFVGVIEGKYANRGDGDGYTHA